MSKKERRRLRVLEHLKVGVITLKEAAALMQVSYRQARRIRRRYLARGAQGLVHGSRGRESNRKTQGCVRQAILARYRERYAGFGPTFATEKLVAEGYRLHPDTLRRWLIQEGLWQRQRDRSAYRSRRPPKRRFGEMVQLDGSHHSWFEERGQSCCLMSLVDDATRTTMAFLAEQETTEAAMRLLWSWVERYGIPMSLYCDRKNAYISDREPTLEEQLEGKQPLTAFGKACEKLGIELIAAYSPQAKGRVERRHGLFQDRFVKELRLAGIADRQAANRLLGEGFLQDLNRRFTVAPLEPEDAHVRLPKTVNLSTIFCLESLRVVSADWVVQYAGRYFQVLRERKVRVPPGSKVTVAEWLDGSIHLLFEKRQLPFAEITDQVLAQARRKAS